MKRIAFTGLVAAFVALTIFSCNKTEKFNPLSSEKAVATISSATSTCTSDTIDLIAGQNINVGTVIVENNAVSLFVTYTTTNGWMIECNHLYVGSLENAPTNGPGNPQIGHFPIHQCFDPMVNTVTYEIPLSSLGSSFIVAAQAEVSQEIDGVVTRQTAWIDGTPFSDRGNWATYYEYTPGTCQTASASETSDTEDVCYEDVVAWADGEPYGSGTNCGCTYVVYEGVYKVADLIANQTLNAGEVSFSPADEGNVTITISLAAGWELQDVQYCVKIEWYDTEPSKKPKAYDFTYKGNETTIIVPASNYYGVHLNLQHVVSCN